MGCQKKEYPITNSQLKPAALNSVLPDPTACQRHTAARCGLPMAKNGTKVAQKGAQIAQNGSRRLTKISPNPHFPFKIKQISKNMDNYPAKRPKLWTGNTINQWQSIARLEKSCQRGREGYNGRQQN
jgi:hypothetical protein